MSDTLVVVTCEHGGHGIPYRFEALFDAHKDIIRTHRGWDIGSWDMAYIVAEGLNAPIFTTTVTRLLIDCNRSPGNPKLFSFITKPLGSARKQEIIDQFYMPFREPVEKVISDSIASGGKVVHLSIHSFTPILNGVARICDIGILYDPSRRMEKALGSSMRDNLTLVFPDKRIRCNYPYRGTSDGFASFLRKRFADDVYRGIEIEFNQKWAPRVLTWRRLGEAVVSAVSAIIEEKIGDFRPNSLENT